MFSSVFMALRRFEALLNASMQAAADGRQWQQAVWIFEEMRAKAALDLISYSCMATLLARESLEVAKRFVENTEGATLEYLYLL